MSRDGIIPTSERQDSVGPVARTVKDASHILTITLGKTDLDRRTLQVPFEIPDYAASCTPTDLSKTRIGIPRNAIRDVPKSVLKEFQRAIKIIAEFGVDIIKNADFSSDAERDAWTQRAAMFNQKHFREAIEEHCKTLFENPNNIRTVNDIIEFTKSYPKEEYPSLNMDLWLGSATSKWYGWVERWAFLAH